MKKLIVTCLCIILAVLVFAGIGIYNLDFIVKTAVNAYGPEVTKTEMHLDGVDVSVLRGRARLENFVIGNPEGFEAPHAIRIGSVFVDVDETSLIKDTIIIDRIEVSQAEITYEIKGNTDNIETIINNIKKNKSTPKSTHKPAEKNGTKRKAGKKVVIRDLILRDITVRMVIAGLKGESISTRISKVHLKNIGERENGLLLSDIFLQVLNALHGEIISPDVISVLTNGLKVFGVEIEHLGHQTKDQLDSIADDLFDIKDEVETIADQFKEMFAR